MASIVVHFEISDEEAPTNLYKARALLKRVSILKMINIGTGLSSKKILIEGEVVQRYATCTTCGGSFRLRVDGHVVRHGCPADEEP